MKSIRITAEHSGKAALWIDNEGDLELLSVFDSHQEAVIEGQILAKELREALRKPRLDFVNNRGE